MRARRRKGWGPARLRPARCAQARASVPQGPWAAVLELADAKGVLCNRTSRVPKSGEICVVRAGKRGTAVV